MPSVLPVLVEVENQLAGLARNFGGDSSTALASVPLLQCNHTGMIVIHPSVVIKGLPLASGCPRRFDCSAPIMGLVVKKVPRRVIFGACVGVVSHSRIGSQK